MSFNTFGGLFAFGGAAPNGDNGLLITATGGNQLVTTNAFSGNCGNGIEIGGNASGVTVTETIAGLDTTGTKTLANRGDGILITGTAHNNTIGGSTKDVLSGNQGYGIAITGHAYFNQVFNSNIGTSSRGEDALGNQKGGVFVGGSAFADIIGGFNNGTGQPVANLVSANNGNGITLGGASRFSLVINNLIGFDRNGDPVLPNTGLPIAVTGNIPRLTQKPKTPLPNAATRILPLA